MTRIFEQWEHPPPLASAPAGLSEGGVGGAALTTQHADGQSFAPDDDDALAQRARVQALLRDAEGSRARVDAALGDLATWHDEIHAAQLGGLALADADDEANASRDALRAGQAALSALRAEASSQDSAAARGGGASSSSGNGDGDGDGDDGDARGQGGGSSGGLKRDVATQKVLEDARARIAERVDAQTAKLRAALVDARADVDELTASNLGLQVALPFSARRRSPVRLCAVSSLSSPSPRRLVALASSPRRRSPVRLRAVSSLSPVLSVRYRRAPVFSAPSRRALSSRRWPVFASSSVAPTSPPQQPDGSSSSVCRPPPPHQDELGTLAHSVDDLRPRLEAAQRAEGALKHQLRVQARVLFRLRLPIG